MKRQQFGNIAIVGAGKVGSVLGKILATRGSTIVSVVSRTRGSAQRAGKFLQCRNVSTSLDSIPPETDLILITTPHDAIEEVAANLSRVRHLQFRRLAVCHASGMLSAEALRPLRRKGATVFSFHPLQTFPRDFKPKGILGSVRGIYYGVDGTRAALLVAKRLAARLDGKIIQIRPEMRPLYHAACVVASNHLTALFSVLEQLFVVLGGRRGKFLPVFEPIIMATLKNVRSTSPERALSGPVARGGVGTVTGHFRAVERFAADMIPYFVAMTDETIRLAIRKGSITRRRARELRAVTAAFSTNHAYYKERR